MSKANETDKTVDQQRVLLDRTKVESGQRRERRDGDRGRGPRERGRGRGRAEVIQSHSIFEQGPGEMMMKKRGMNSAGLGLCCFR